MKQLDRLDSLIDLSLNGEASEAEVSELQELVASSEEMMNHYFESIDHQLTLKQQFEDSTLETTETNTDSKNFPLFRLIIPLIVVGLMIYMVSKGGRDIPQKTQFTISNESHDVSVLRNSKDLANITGITLENLDLIDVDTKGELWLKSSNDDSIFLAGGSQLRMEKKSTESFQLLKGSISADLSESKSVLSFITRDVEIVAEGAFFATKIKNNFTKVCVAKGSVQITRLKDGSSITLKENEAATSEFLKKTTLTPDESHIFPKLENGVNYYYFELNGGVYDENRLIDEGIVNNLSIKKGQHEGYVRGRPDSHSDVAKGPFHILLKTNFKSDKKSTVSFKIYGRKGSSLEIADQKTLLTKDFETQIIKVQLNEGFHPLKVHSPGVLGKDEDDYDLQIEYSLDNENFIPIPDDLLFHRNPHPLPDQFSENNINRSLSAHLPLKGNFKDIINNQEAAPIGSPQFIKDPEFGLVCELDGKKDHLIHLPVDRLGMAQDYTASAWIKIREGSYYDQPLFANSSGGYNATLVLLIRRMHPYLAHLHDDTVAGEKLEYNEWAHVVFRYHNGEQAIFLNGKLAVNSYNHSSLFSNQPMLIGYWNGKRRIKGLLRDIRIYNTALSANDIALLYKKTGKKKNEGQ